MSAWTEQQIDTAVAQVRKWTSSRDEGWHVTRPQATVLADTVEALRAEVGRANEVAFLVRRLHRSWRSGAWRIGALNDEDMETLGELLAEGGAS